MINYTNQQLQEKERSRKWSWKGGRTGRWKKWRYGQREGEEKRQVENERQKDEHGERLKDIELVNENKERDEKIWEDD